ncbi:MAG: helix-turn-helix transcriptional regulator [Methylophilaceae bacterium]
MINFNQQETENKRLAQWAVAICSVVFTLIVLDIVGDYQDGIAWTHLVIELLILLASLMGIVYFGWLFLKTTQSKIKALTLDLNTANQQAEQWRNANRNLLAGLSKQIFKQFQQWGLTQAESEVGMLMLKGFSFQEAADVRATSERTIREQARSIYRKSGLAGRSELSAFFLEDLLPPQA